MIIKLEHSDVDVAEQIHLVLQSSYKVEADLIGASDFPPLARTSSDIADAGTEFFACTVNEQIAGVIEITLVNRHLDIHSLTVDPQFFRRGIAGKLLEFVLSSFDCDSADVETAVANLPAIRLYEKYGFAEYKRWIPSHGIEKVAMKI